LFGVPARPSLHLDPRSPLVLDTRELGRRAGSMREVRRELPAPPGWSLELVSVPVGVPVVVDLRLESVMDGVLVTGTVTAPVDAECGRCLDPVHSEVVASIQELFAYEPDPQDEDALGLDGDFIDLAPVARDAVVLSLPINPLCDEDCLGLCAVCGARLADVEPDHSHDNLDSRWAALAGLSDATDPGDTGSRNTEEHPTEEN
jgi:DUF177 domain-containing protein